MSRAYILYLDANNLFGVPEELHKPIIKKYERRRVMVYNIDDIWSRDLINKVNIANSNKGYKYILTVIDTFTKYAYAILLKSKDR